ncbi:DUF4442 domain-containing protein [bacterium]|nr:DUF4442 domain-containing protein [bacterium]
MKKYLFYLWNFWPPFLGAGIKVDHVSSDMMSTTMRLKKRFWNRNIVGTQYGGSIYSMVDPIYMAMMLSHLNREFIIWDKSASIRFRKPGKTDLFAHFTLTQQDLDEIRNRMKTEAKIDWERSINIVDKDQNVVAEVTKVIHIRRK